MNTIEIDPNKGNAMPAESPLKASPSGTAEKRPLKLGRTGIIVAVLLIAGATAGFVPRWRQRAAANTDTRELAIPSVTLVSPTPGKAANGMALPAEIKPALEASIYARTNGYLKRRLVDIGSHVEAGQLLAEIDAPEVDSQLEQARAQLALAEANLELAKTTDDRWQQLLKTGVVSKQEADDKKAADAVAAANTQAMRANVHRLEEMQGFERVVAPFAGTVTLRNVEAGDLIVASSGKEMFHLAQTRTLDIYVRVPQTQALGIRPGLTANVTIPEMPGQVFKAKVKTTSEAMSPVSRTLQTELELDNSKYQIVTGSYAEVRFTSATDSPALTLPSNAVLFRAGGLEVGVVRPDNTVELRKVQVGRDFGKTVQVLAGVSASDHVIANPSDSLVSGATVRVANTSEVQTAEQVTKNVSNSSENNYAQARSTSSRVKPSKAVTDIAFR